MVITATENKGLILEREPEVFHGLKSQLETPFLTKKGVLELASGQSKLRFIRFAFLTATPSNCGESLRL